MSNATVDQHLKGQSTRPRMSNGLDQKNPSVPADEFDSSYIPTPNVNQGYGMAPTTDSFMPSYYGQMPFPYMGGTEWSSGSDSMPYVPGYSGETQQHSFLPDAIFSHQPGATPTYYNQSYNYFPTNNEFSAWATPSTAPGGGMPDNTVTGFGQQSATANPYNGDYYSIMPATPHDYLGGNDMLPTTNGNVLGHNATGATIPGVGNTVMSSGDVSGKLSGGVSSNGMKMVEQGIQNMGLGVSSIAPEPLKQQMPQNLTITNSGTSAGNSSVSSQSAIMPGTSMPVQLGQSNSNSGGNNAPVPGSNAPKPVSWAAIASKPAKPQPKPKAKATGQGLPPPIRHNMDIGTWDVALPSNKGPARGALPDQQNIPQRWSAPRQGGNAQRYGPGLEEQGGNNQNALAPDGSSNVINAHLSAEEIGSAVLNKLKSENDYNPKRLTLDVRNARFFVIKSYSEDDIHRSIKYNIWCSTEHGNKRLDAAFREQQGRGPVILFYSVNGSGHFCGVAEMLTPIDYSKRAGVWAQDKWKGKFQVKWIYAKDVPNSLLRHIRLENNENKPVTNSRDTQEVPAEKGRQVLKIISTYKHQTSIFDDFLHYERRQVEEEGQRAKRSNQMRSRDYSKRGERQSSPGQEQARN